jgi:hypothetical protein
VTGPPLRGNEPNLDIEIRGGLSWLRWTGPPLRGYGPNLDNELPKLRALLAVEEPSWVHGVAMAAHCA